jgi:hypothetical protein
VQNRLALNVLQERKRMSIPENKTSSSLSTLSSMRQSYKHIPYLFSLVKGVRTFFRNLTYKPIYNQLEEFRNLILFHQTKTLQSSHPNPLNKFGKKCFSQTDEDGITLEILKRIKQLDDGAYAEFGVGDGTENNTLILAALGWKGFWVGGEKLKIDIGKACHKRFAYLRDWITLENILDLTKKGCAEIDSVGLDVVSLDLDGNDIYFVEELLGNGFKPKLFIVEYNAKFPPPVEFEIAYDPKHIWRSDDYYGASLASFNSLFNNFGYKLVCCNSHTGVNAFFVDSSFSEFFSDVPNDIDQIYVEPRHHRYTKYGHTPSLRTINRIINGD